MILKYNSDSTSLSPHSDDEGDIIDQSKAICNYSIGSSRTLEFFDKSKGKAVTDVRMASNSLTIMKAGTQELMKHCVRAEMNSNSRSISDNSQLRFSLSFRALTNFNVSNNDSVSSDIVKDSAGVNKGNMSETGEMKCDTADQVKSAEVKKHICLLAGDSFAERIDENRLGRDILVVKNIGKGGAKISHVMEQLEDFSFEHGDVYCR